MSNNCFGTVGRPTAASPAGRSLLVGLLLGGVCLTLLSPLAPAYGQDPPAAIVKEVESFDDTSARVDFVIPSGEGKAPGVTVFYGTQEAGPTQDGWDQKIDVQAPGKGRERYSVILKDLQPERLYSARVCTTDPDSQTEVWSKPVQFRTEATPTPWYVALGIAALVIALIVVPFMVGSSLARMFRMPDYGWKIGLVLCSLACGIAIVVVGWPPKRGIDLSGGVILVYEIDQQEKEKRGRTDTLTKAEMDKVIAAVSKRINPGGVKEVTVRQHGVEQIEIIIPEVDAVEARRTKRKVSQTGSLEFRILANRRNYEDLIKRALEDRGNRLFDPADPSKLQAWWVPVEEKQKQSFEHYMYGDDGRVLPPSSREIAIRESETRGIATYEVLVVKDLFDVTGTYLSSSRAGWDERGQPCVNFTFDSTGGRLFGGLTNANLPDPVSGFRRQLGIILDGYLYSAPGIKSTIYDRGEISGTFTQEEVEDLVSVLNAGSLENALAKEPISEMVTGPTLGQDTIDRGTWAIVISMAVVLIFMLFYYRFAGIVACGALLANLVLILAVMILINAAFTLPGLAGLVLTVGMAVDANVLIFERIREELARGAALRMAIRNGFGRATTTIVDANVTTLITGIVLYWIGTDQVKGFAVTLILGVTLSMYTAIFCSRIVFDVAERRRWISKLSMMRILGGTQIDFLGRRYLFGAASLIVIVIGLVAVGARGKGLLDIDFTGGVSVQVLFNKPQEKIADVRKALEDLLPDLAVSDVQIGDEEALKRFMVNTSQEEERDEKNQVVRSAIEIVQEKIDTVFGDALATNAVTIEDFGPAAEPAEETATAKPAGPDEEARLRKDLPDDSLLAMAGTAPLLLAQADPPDESPPAAEPDSEPAPGEGDSEATAEDTPEETSDEPAEETPAEMPEADADTPAEEADQPAEEKAADEPADEPAEDAAEPTSDQTPKAAEDEPPEDAPEATPQDVPETPAEKTPSGPVDPYAEGTLAVLTFNHPISADTLTGMFEEEFGKDSTPDMQLSSPDQGYREGDGQSYHTWNVKIRLKPDQVRPRVESMQQKLAHTPFFPTSTTIGGKVAGSTRTLAITALVTSLLCIVGYIWIRFQRVVFGLAAVVALVHDVLVTLGVIAISFYLAQIPGVQNALLIDPFKIGLPALAAFLTIIGYSLNDTIVVFDRIREVRGKSPQLTQDMVNTSINQTLARTLLTSLTTLIVVLILYAFGGQGIHGFAFALVIGVLVGTYSSIFVASPVLLWMSRPSGGK